MNPVKFKHHNIVFAEDQPEYQPLPALKIDSPQGEVISCWRMTFLERLRVLFFGRIWLSLYSFNKPLTPSLLSTNSKDLFTVSERPSGYQPNKSQSDECNPPPKKK